MSNCKRIFREFLMKTKSFKKITRLKLKQGLDLKMNNSRNRKRSMLRKWNTFQNLSMKFFTRNWKNMKWKQV